MKTIQINNRIIGGNNPVYIIAELSANHEQKFDLAKQTIIAMKGAGADAVKLQSYLPESITLDSDKSWFRTRNDSIWAGQRMYDLFKKAYTPREWHKDLQKLSHSLNMDFFSSPFDLQDVDFLEDLNVLIYKIASPEIVDIPLIKKVAETGKPIIISSGAATEKDLKLATETIRATGNDQIAILKCTTAYPTPYSEVNLATIQKIKADFNVVVGLSDHTLGTTVPIAAVALGAKIIEKHFVLDKNGNGIDKEFSLEPKEFSQMVKSVREAELAIGKASYELTERMHSARKITRSLFAVNNIKKGELLTSENIKSLRPNLGLHPQYYYNVIGKKATQDIGKGEPLQLKFIDF